MIKVENVNVYNLARAVYSARNAMNSWDKSDSDLEKDILGPNDLGLAQRLYKGGPVHAKYLRQIIVNLDITSNHTFWGEFDTYKVGTTRNSCSKMHKIHVKPFELNDFSHEGVDEVGGKTKEIYIKYLEELERLRQQFNSTKEKKYWRAIIDMLPLGFNLKATITMNYQVVMNMLDWRSNHKMDEWIELCEILRGLPYIKEIRGEK